jgi:hypothetical protein
MGLPGAAPREVMMTHGHDELPMPGSPEARERGCTCPDQHSPVPPWEADGDCPLHGYGANPENRKLND